MKNENDYLDDDLPEHIKEIMQTKGIHREILEVRNLKAVTELCIKTTKNLKYQNLTNLFYAITGSIITFVITSNYTNSNNINVTNEQFKQYKDSIQIEVDKLNIQLGKQTTNSK